ncbi:MAG: hypothetical protein AB8B74_11395 [Crocinitomicaceae bacterium]
MAANYVKFRRVLDRERGNDIRRQLADHQIDSDLTDISTQFDINNVGGISHCQFEIQIAPENFEKAEQILEDNAKSIILELDESHYLYEFSKEELYGIIQKPDEWSPTDYLLAQKILRDKGEVIDDKQLKRFKDERYQSLDEPRYTNALWIFAYVCAFFLDTVLGVILGAIILGAKRTLPNGESAYYYSQRNRNHAKVIIPLGIIVFLIHIWFSLRLRGIVTGYVTQFSGISQFF